MRHKFYQKSKTPNDGTCLGEPPEVFVMLIFILLLLFFICWCSLFTFPFQHHPLPFCGLLPSRVICDTFIFRPFHYLLTASATVLSGFFLPTGVFYLTLLPDIFHTTYFHQGFPGSWPLFLESWRASYWSLKHRPGPSVCLIHSSPQSSIHLNFVFMHINIAKYFLVVKTLIRSAATLFSSHENIKWQPN